MLLLSFIFIVFISHTQYMLNILQLRADFFFHFSLSGQIEVAKKSFWSVSHIITKIKRHVGAKTNPQIRTLADVGCQTYITKKRY